MKKILVIQTTVLTSLLIAFPVFAQSADVTKVTTFIQSIVQVLITISGATAVGFIVLGGLGYITSSGNPESLDKSKKTIFFAAIGLCIVRGAFVLSNIITQLATSAFGTTH